MKESNDLHKNFIKQALSLAAKAKMEDEVPVGALIVQNGIIVAESYNKREKNQSAIAHAEILAIELACQKLNSWRLSACEMYVTLEPCLMCAGALLQTRIRGVYFGAFDPKGGALGSLYTLHDDPRLNHRFHVTGGICKEDCGALLSEFFKKKRKS
jgi:tRNA(adenine34) deaminase